ncbi:hypothetical protein [Oxalobacter paraformigenes]|uniref:hypothetical protein n=1 Tax=Oxalobacter paraformigenes TaxID=556268 RepID=UPI00059547FF|nr:hypothetical protein [Oxalobacter paraformigenes]
MGKNGQENRVNNKDTTNREGFHGKKELPEKKKRPPDDTRAPDHAFSLKTASTPSGQSGLTA